MDQAAKNLIVFSWLVNSLNFTVSQMRRNHEETQLVYRFYYFVSDTWEALKQQVKSINNSNCSEPWKARAGVERMASSSTT